MENNLNLQFSPRSSRAQQSRFYKRFGKLVQVLSLVILVLGLLGGIVLLLSGNGGGWIVVFIGLWALVPLMWCERSLKDLKPPKHPRSINDLLSRELMGLLPDNPTPASTLKALIRTPGANFFSARFGIPLGQIAEVTPDDASMMPDVWQEALNIRTALPDRIDTLSSCIVIAAIIRLNARITEPILNQLRIDMDDIFAGTSWFEHIDDLSDELEEPVLTGGVARDWSFGYIPTLRNFGINLSEKYSKGARSIMTKMPSTQSIVQDMVKLMSTAARRNVALIGPLGVGKSTIVEAFAETLMNSRLDIPKEIKFNQVFMLDASAILSATGRRGEVEHLVTILMNEAYRAKNIILFLDNAELFFTDDTGAIDLSNMLMPVIEAGGLKLILAMDEQKFLQIIQQKPAMASSLNRIEIKQPDEKSTMMIMEERCLNIEYTTKSFFTYQSLREAYRLSSRYNNSAAQPRASIQLLQSATQYADNGIVTPQVLAITIERTLGIKVGGALSQSGGQAEREKLLNLESLIHERMINQSSAVKAVSSALRRARTGVRNENRPIGTFLFLGPTGVGKTELAKSLAAVYFGGEDNLVRIDMNEYVRQEDVARLIADGAIDPMSLTAQVLKNPFSVVLLDEIEKAHPNVLTALLQVLDEGILRDINNREVSFRDVIVIATSNAGAERIRQYIKAGYQVEQFSEQFQNELIQSGQFKPEFLNRFDEIAVFRPLTKDELLQVVDLILKGVNKNLSSRKMSVAVDEAGRRLLVDSGYDPLLGARPMRRVVQKTVENILAEKVLTGEASEGSTVYISAADISKALAENS